MDVTNAGLGTDAEALALGRGIQEVNVTAVLYNVMLHLKCRDCDFCMRNVLLHMLLLRLLYLNKQHS